jgi:hypothetical protein
MCSLDDGGTDARSRGATPVRLAYLGRGRPTGLPIDPLRPFRYASCCARGPARTPTRAFAAVRLTLSQVVLE